MAVRSQPYRIRGSAATGKSYSQAGVRSTTQRRSAASQAASGSVPGRTMTGSTPPERATVAVVPLALSPIHCAPHIVRLRPDVLPSDPTPKHPPSPGDASSRWRQGQRATFRSGHLTAGASTGHHHFVGLRRMTLHAFIHRMSSLRNASISSPPAIMVWSCSRVTSSRRNVPSSCPRFRTVNQSPTSQA
jgi:hypothetical protein